MWILDSFSTIVGIKLLVALWIDTEGACRQEVERSESFAEDVNHQPGAATTGLEASLFAETVAP